MKLYYHPISSYSQKTLMAFFEKGVAFEPLLVNLMSETERAQYLKVNPLGKVPFLRVEEEGLDLPESSIIIEYIDGRAPGGTRLVPDDAAKALEARLWDRFWDQYLNEPMQKIFFDGRRPPDKRDPFGVEQAKRRLETSYGIADQRFATRTWSIGDAFSMADCAAAPALMYASRVLPFDAHPNLAAYSRRLLARPSYLRVLEEAGPFLARLGAG